MEPTAAPEAATTNGTPSAAAPGDSANTVEVYNPATGQLIGSVPAMTPDEVTATVARARAAQPAWAAAGFDERARILRRAQKWTIDNAERIITTIVAENGKTYEDAQLAEISYVANAFGFWAKNAPELPRRREGQVLVAVRARPQAQGPLRAGRRRRRDRPLELPADELLRRLHPGARRRQLGRPQAGHA